MPAPTVGSMTQPTPTRPEKPRRPSSRRGLKNRRPRDAPTIELLRAILLGLPHLPSAACSGQGRLFDAASDDDHARAAALALCRSCDALGACRAWAQTVPPSRLVCQVIAGEFRATKNKPVSQLREQEQLRLDLVVSYEMVQ
jgi:hypothetical protein